MLRENLKESRKKSMSKFAKDNLQHLEDMGAKYFKDYENIYKTGILIPDFMDEQANKKALAKARKIIAFKKAAGHIDGLYQLVAA